MKHLLAVIALLIGTAVSAGTVVKLDNTLIISGPIDQTTRYMFDNYFTASITHIQLESPGGVVHEGCLLYTSPSPRDRTRSRMPSSA